MLVFLMPNTHTILTANKTDGVHAERKKCFSEMLAFS